MSSNEVRYMEILERLKRRSAKRISKIIYFNDLIEALHGICKRVDNEPPKQIITVKAFAVSPS